MIFRKHNPHPTIRAIAQAFSLAVILALAALPSSCSKESVISQDENKPAAGKPVQLGDFNITMLDAPQVKLAELTSQNKVIVFDFWATWCGPCRLEIPHLVELQREYKDKGVEVIGLSLEDPQADADKVRQFAKEMNINYRLGFSSMGMFNSFNGNDPRGSIPQTFVFDRSGKLVKWIHGMNPQTIRMTLRDSVERALQQSE
ncbi:MAG TPA: TlpA disulfide reductase family protein [Blastocatellia bacterium]|nr:TlpA disulfide reductase family protein [Blastocatellia bacterium]